MRKFTAVLAMLLFFIGMFAFSNKMIYAADNQSSQIKKQEDLTLLLLSLKEEAKKGKVPGFQFGVGTSEVTVLDWKKPQGTLENWGKRIKEYNYDEDGDGIGELCITFEYPLGIDPEGKIKNISKAILDKELTRENLVATLGLPDRELWSKGDFREAEYDYEDYTLRFCNVIDSEFIVEIKKAPCECD